ncbi:MAG: tricarballylate utilization 4Fe-4S protein TcuB [Pseudomonadota bacterium]|nr:tricarballylate utilization 4Fe-4S protein TcuB [Pseudomonadota bacterium]
MQDARGSGPVPLVLRAEEAEVARVMTICNACRYCEGFCSVFPAMERRLDFVHGDIHFLANLCHNCGACLEACQYAAPNAFNVNVPRSLSAVRELTYEDYAWPQALSVLYRRQGLWLAFGTMVSLAIVLGLAAFFSTSRTGSTEAAFYAVIPHRVMVLVFGAVALWIVLAFAIGATRFWRGLPAKPARVAMTAASGEAIRNSLTLRYLDGGGAGCNQANDAPTHARRRFHHVTFYGFIACFAATLVATFYHYVLQLPAPYALTSLPVLLGTTGGVGLIVGPIGLWWLHGRRPAERGDPRQKTMDRGFIALLIATSVTGLVLLIVRATPAMPSLLVIHLAIVLALFLSLPYGKFAHAVYRVAALLKDAIENRQPSTMTLKLD